LSIVQALRGVCLQIEEEDGMYQFLEQVAADRMANLREYAAGARLARDARRQAPATGLRNLARRMSAAIADLNQAQRRLTALTMSTERHEPQPNKSPDTYDEFLARTAGPLLHEPTGARRLTGRGVR